MDSLACSAFVFIWLVYLVRDVEVLVKCYCQTLNLAQRKIRTIVSLPAPKPLVPNYCPVNLQLSHAAAVLVTAAAAAVAVNQHPAVNSLASTKRNQTNCISFIHFCG